MSDIADHTLNLLIVDDDKDHAKQLAAAARKLLKSSGELPRIRTATRERELANAMAVLEPAARNYALLDLDLGEWLGGTAKRDGWTMLASVLNASEGARVVLYTTQTDPGDLGRALERGAYDLVSQDNIDDAQTGILAVLAGFLEIERRLREAKGELPAIGLRDPLAQLLLQVRTGLSIIGRHGHIWWQNEINKVINGCDEPEGRRCFTCLHPWECREAPCPWCPTFEVLRVREGRQRALILPLGPRETPDTIALRCIEMASEPLKVEFEEGGSPACAGAIESVMDRTAEWERQTPIHRIVDLLIVLAGLAASGRGPVRINLHEVSESGLVCRPIASCWTSVSEAEERPLEFTTDLHLEVVEASPGWKSGVGILGPSASLQGRQVSSLGGTLRFDLAGHPQDTAILREWRPFDPASAPGVVEDLGWYEGDADQTWASCLWTVGGGAPGEDARAVLLEVRQTGGGCLSGSCGKDPKACDCTLYLERLAQEAKLLRKARAEKRLPKYYRMPDLRECRTETALWEKVASELKRLASDLGLKANDMWGHFRRLGKAPAPGGSLEWDLEISDAAQDALKSPYVACLSPDNRTTSIPPPEEWQRKGEELGAQQPGFDPCRRPISREAGSYLCRILGEARLCHEPPPSDAPHWSSVLGNAQRTDPGACERLQAVRSYGDWPVGDSSHPIGTFHIHSTDDDLFAPKQVMQFFETLITQIDRGIVRLESEQLEKERDDRARRLEHGAEVAAAVGARLVVIEGLAGDLDTNDVAGRQRLVTRIRAVQSLAPDFGLPLGVRHQTVQLQGVLGASWQKLQNDLRADALWASYTPQNPFPEGVSGHVDADVELLSATLAALVRWALGLADKVNPRAMGSAALSVEVHVGDQGAAAAGLRVAVAVPGNPGRGPVSAFKRTAEGADMLTALQAAREAGSDRYHDLVLELAVVRRLARDAVRDHAPAVTIEERGELIAGTIRWTPRNERKQTADA